MAHACMACQLCQKKLASQDCPGNGKLAMPLDSCSRPDVKSRARALAPDFYCGGRRGAEVGAPSEGTNEVLHQL